FTHASATYQKTKRMCQHKLHRLTFRLIELEALLLLKQGDTSVDALMRFAAPEQHALAGGLTCQHAANPLRDTSLERRCADGLIATNFVANGRALFESKRQGRIGVAIAKQPPDARQ